MNGRNPDDREIQPDEYEHLYDMWLEKYWEDHNSNTGGSNNKPDNNTTNTSDTDKLPEEEETIIDQDGYDKYAENRSDDKRRGM